VFAVHWIDVRDLNIRNRDCKPRGFSRLTCISHKHCDQGSTARAAVDIVSHPAAGLNRNVMICLVLTGRLTLPAAAFITTSVSSARFER
jgi:hypothetical protein